MAAGVGIALVVAIGIAMTRGSTGTGLTQLSSAPLGLNIAPWDSATAHVENIIEPLLKRAGILQLRYGGGSYADHYDWQTNTSIQRSCLLENPTASFTPTCTSYQPLSFAQFSRQAQTVGADSFVTVNYGSGTPAEAAAWVTAAKSISRGDVALWEIGNESYGCWEVDNELAGAPEHYQGYKPALPDSASAFENERTCPQVTEGNAKGTKTLATSYAVNALSFLEAMKKADSSARIGVPWAFGNNVEAASVPDSSEWNNLVLKTDGKYVSFVDAHYYPFQFYGSAGGGNPTAQDILRSLLKIPSLYDSIRVELNTLDRGASVVIGETAVSSQPTTATCTAVGAVFAAGDVLSWLAAGAESVDWWYMNDGGNSTLRCAKPGSGFFTSSSPPTPETPYYGYLLSSILAQPYAMVGKLSTTDPSDVLAFQATLTNGKYAVAFINTDTHSSKTVGFRLEEGLSGRVRTWSYSAANQNSKDSEIVTGIAPASTVTNGLRLPAESIVVFETQ